MGYLDESDVICDNIVYDIGRYSVAECIGREHDYADIWEVDCNSARFIGTAFFPELLDRGIRTRNGEYSEEKLTEFVMEKFGKKPQEKTE